MTEVKTDAGADFNPYPASSKEEPKSTPRVRWLTNKKIEERIELEFPFALDDVEYRAIIVKRPSVKDIETFLTDGKSNPEKIVRFPLFYDDHGNALPNAFWDTIRDDDQFKLWGIAEDFLPVRFKEQPAVTIPSESSRETGAIGGNSSGT